jgi:hypothetical protein
MAISWRHFEGLVKTRRRFTFLMEEPKYEDAESPTSPAVTLSSIIGSAEDAGIVRELPTDCEILRVRIHNINERVTRPTQIGTPKAAKLKYAKRMSPAGIPMFYGSSDPKTAFYEVFDRTKDSSVLGFLNLRIHSGFSTLQTCQRNRVYSAKRIIS